MRADLDELWRFVLRRPIEPEERAATEARLAAGMSYASLLHELATSDEFEHLRRLEDAVAWAAAQRRARERPRNLTAPAGVDERPVEIPWCLARLREDERVLDVGYAFAEGVYLDALAALGGVTGVDLVHRDVPGVETVQADLRALPFADGAFDVAVAISTLEHVGRDNTQYRLAPEQNDTLDAALRELRRVAARVLVTVPTGEHELLPEQAVYEPSEWVARFERAGFAVFEDELYELTAEGWRSVQALSPGLRYGARGPGASAVLCAELRPATLGERLRLAVRDRRHRDEARRATSRAAPRREQEQDRTRRHPAGDRHPDTGVAVRAVPTRRGRRSPTGAA
ncbi:MAG TPA: class I SAM-dependent methyltransferase [Gaiellaceae bacterium]|nr:class I SAM-dependent methyltransferase [Gaiellaceae bacterium]